MFEDAPHPDLLMSTLTSNWVVNNIFQFDGASLLVCRGWPGRQVQPGAVLTRSDRAATARWARPYSRQSLE
jgi:hypothetical protein